VPAGLSEADARHKLGTAPLVPTDTQLRQMVVAWFNQIDRAGMDRFPILDAEERQAAIENLREDEGVLRMLILPACKARRGD
jgi:hypothetical protein